MTSVLARPTALYVEDRLIYVLLMQALFERLPDARLVVASDGAEALQMARGLKPALLLLDDSLPDCDGAELLAQLRLLPDCRQAPAVAVTAEIGPDFAQRGFAETWIKPLNLPRTLVRLRHLLGVSVRSVDAQRMPMGQRPALPSEAAARAALQVP